MASNTTDVYEEIEETVEVGPEYSIDFVLVCTLFTSVAVVAASAEIVTQYIIRKFKRLRNQHHNVYILHHSLFNLVFLLLFTLSIYMHKLNIAMKWIHFLTLDAIFTLLFVQSYLTMLMTIDWYLLIFCPSKSAVLRKSTKIIIASAYLYVGIVWLYSLVVTLTHGYPGFLSILLVTLTYLTAIIMLCVFGAIYLCRRKTLLKPNCFVLKIAVLKYFIWLPILMTVPLGIAYRSEITRYFAIFFMLLIFLTPAIQLFAFYFWDRNYKAALSRMFDCAKHGEAEDIDLDDSVEEGAMVYNANNGQVEHLINNSP